MAEDLHCLVAVEPTPLEYWVATSDPRDLSVFDDERKKNPEKPQLEILRALAEKYPKGTVGIGEQTKEIKSEDN